MDKKDLQILKKAVGKPDKTSISRHCGCYVNLYNNEMHFQDPVTLSSTDDSETIQYLSFLKKGLNGTPGTNIFDIDVGTNVLENIKTTALKDREEVRKACAVIKDALKDAEDDYCIYFAYGEEDLPGDVSYDFVICLIIPCPLSKPGIAYDQNRSRFMGMPKNRVLSAPVLTYLYPSLADRVPDVSKAACFIKSAKNSEKASEICRSLFGNPLPASAVEQKETFKKMLAAGHDGCVPFKEVKDVFEKIAERKLDASLKGNELEFTPAELTEIIKKAGSDNNAPAVEEEAGEAEGTVFSAENIVPKTINIENGHVSIRIDLNSITDLNRRTIDGVDYWIIPAAGSSVEGIPVKN